MRDSLGILLASTLVTQTAAGNLDGTTLSIPQGVPAGRRLVLRFTFSGAYGSVVNAVITPTLMGGVADDTLTMALGAPITLGTATTGTANYVDVPISTLEGQKYVGARWRLTPAGTGNVIGTFGAVLVTSSP